MAAADELDAIIDGLDRFPRSAVELVNNALADAIKKQARADTGGDFILSGAARRGQTPTALKVRKKIDGTVFVVGTVSASPQRVRAQWAWLDKGTKSGGKRGKHPGTRPKKTFTGPADRLLPLLERRVAERFEIAIRR